MQVAVLRKITCIYFNYHDTRKFYFYVTFHVLFSLMFRTTEIPSDIS